MIQTYYTKSTKIEYSLYPRIDSSQKCHTLFFFFSLNFFPRSYVDVLIFLRIQNRLETILNIRITFLKPTEKL